MIYIALDCVLNGHIDFQYEKNVKKKKQTYIKNNKSQFNIKSKIINQILIEEPINEINQKTINIPSAKVGYRVAR